MQVIEFIKQNGTDAESIEAGLKALTEQFAISVKKVDDLLVLNYNQIDSPKTHPYVMECRSLILEAETLNVVSRSFDRFFNYGEALNVMPEIDWKRAVAFEKVDGSLIKIYNHKGHWYISTKGTAYADSDCMGYGVTFRELVWKAIGVSNDEEFQLKMRMCIFDESVTYMFELTSVENRVVKRYDGYKLHFLGARCNDTGMYVCEEEKNWFLDPHSDIDFIHYPKEYRFNTVEECLRTSRELKDLDEGYVIYQDGVPIAKVKSPAYVAVHHIRGEGLNPKRIMQLVLVNEQDEYLQYFPEDREVFIPYVEAKNTLDHQLHAVYNSCKWIDNQKEFAVHAQQYPFKSALFQARAKQIGVLQAFNDQRESYKMEILKEYVV
jgi:T4 RnlA family RNA ligase